MSIKNDLEIQEIQALKGLIEKELRDNVELTGRSICFFRKIGARESMKVCPYCQTKVNGLARHVVIVHPEYMHDQIVTQHKSEGSAKP